MQSVEYSFRKSLLKFLRKPLQIARMGRRVLFGEIRYSAPRFVCQTYGNEYTGLLRGGNRKEKGRSFARSVHFTSVQRLNFKSV
jgi:hypothetical protein